MRQARETSALGRTRTVCQGRVVSVARGPTAGGYAGSIVLNEPLTDVRRRAAAALRALPARLRLPAPAAPAEQYPVRYSERLAKLQPAATAHAARLPVSPPGGTVRTRPSPERS